MAEDDLEQFAIDGADAVGGRATRHISNGKKGLKSGAIIEKFQSAKRSFVEGVPGSETILEIFVLPFCALSLEMRLSLPTQHKRTVGAATTVARKWAPSPRLPRKSDDDSNYLENEDNLESFKKVLSRRGRAANVRRCGRVFLNHAVALCDHCFASRFDKNRPVPPQRSPVKHCCSDGCSDEYIIMYFCCTK
uniref:Uncharacterized protein n=1 Tax=Steinernema glaseri TaxID=37863 RepID=A0A1I8AET6_9BILA